MAEEISVVNVVLIAVAALIAFVFIKTVYEIRKTLALKVSTLEEKLSAIERESASVKSLVSAVSEDAKNKIDSAYLDKRIDGLVKLINAK